MESKSYAALSPETLAALDPNASYARIREMVGSGKRVLDAGCGPGNLAAVLRSAGNVVVGIDIDDGGLALAQRACERTIKADLDHAELDDIVGDERFDVVVFADVLEHLRTPARLLSSARRVLRDGGFAIVSIPNVAHGAVRLALLRGRFEYQQLGILDDSHLKFYTRESVLRLLSESGFIATRVERTTAPVFERSDLVPFVRREDFDPAVVAEILRDEDAETLQFVVRAAPLADVAALEVLTAEITSLQQAVRTLRAQLAQARDGSPAGRFEGRPVRANGSNGSRALAERLAEVEQHYRNALALTETTRSERDAAVAELASLRAELEAGGEQVTPSAQVRDQVRQLREQLSQRDDELAAAAERAGEELETVRARVAERNAATESAAAALEEARASNAAALGAVEQLRAELFRVQGVADAFAAERDAALSRAEAAVAELERGTTGSAETELSLRAARALVVQVELERDAAREDAASLRARHEQLALEAEGLRADRDDLAARCGTTDLAERALRDRLVELERTLAEVASERIALRQRASSLESLLIVERTSRRDVEEACDRLESVARRRADQAREAELNGLQARSAVVDLELRLALLKAPRVPAARPPGPVGERWSAEVLRATTRGRRNLTVLAPDPRRERMRARWRRLRRLFPLILLLALCVASCAAPGPTISDPGPAFVRIGDDSSVWYLPAGSATYCLVAEPTEMQMFGGFARVKHYDAGAHIDEARRRDGTCKYPDGLYRVGTATYVLHGDTICRGGPAPGAIVVSAEAKLGVSRRDTGPCRSG